VIHNELTNQSCTSLALMPAHTVSQAICESNATLTKLYFEHRETVLQLQHTLLTQILPNVLDQLALGNRARDSVQEWLQDDRKSPPFQPRGTALSHFIPIKVSIFRTFKVSARPPVSWSRDSF
jgi:hypothetical protein